MRDPKTQAILDDAAALVRRSSVATGADMRYMDAIADRERLLDDDKPFDFLSLFTGDDDTFSTLDELLTD